VWPKACGCVLPAYSVLQLIFNGNEKLAALHAPCFMVEHVVNGFVGVSTLRIRIIRSTRLMCLSRSVWMHEVY
jgi:hypothetical protein